MGTRWMATLSGWTVALALVQLVGCKPQTKNPSTVTINNSQSQQLSTDGGKVSIDDGSSVAIAAGTVAAGTQVTVQKAAAPAEFAAAGSTASSPVQVSATNADGTPASQVATPMTVNLAVSSSPSLTLAAAAVADNLCVLLKVSSNGSLYVWRRSALTYDANSHLAKISTRFFGTFQVVYCGSDTLAGFADASLQGATGESKLAVALTTPAGLDGDLGPGVLCAFVARDDVVAKQACITAGGSSCPLRTTVVSVDQATIQSGTSNVAKPAVPASQIIDGDAHWLAAMLLDSTGKCPLKVGDDLSAVTTSVPGQKSLYAFKLSPQAFKSGVTATIGSAGLLQTTNTNLSLGGPGNFANFTGPDESKVCAYFDLDNGAGFRQLAFSGGQIVGPSPMVLKAPSGSAALGSRNVLRLNIGRDCVSGFDGSLGSPDPKTGHPYWVRLPNALAAAQYLTPVTLKLTVTNPAIGGLNGCIELGKGGSLTATTAATDDAVLGRVAVNFAQSSYQIYLPYLLDTSAQKNGVPVYDVRITALTPGADCDHVKAAIPPVVLPSRPLTATIELPL